MYKGVGLSVWKGNEIRDRLKEGGLIQEVEVRTGRTGAGRPMKCVLPTTQACALVGKAPPPGRGGMLHRHIQQTVAEGARTKGYSVQVEKVLGSGAIVDVFLQRGQETIGVEIAVVSTPERELSHIKACLAAHYDLVYVIFADEKLRERTGVLLQETFSGEEVGRVRLLPLGNLPHFG